MTQSLSIVIPAYNEEDCILQTLQQTHAAVDGIRQEGKLAGVEVLIVDDGSRDRTSEIVVKFIRENGLGDQFTLVRHEVNRGYGAAIKTGFAAAKGELLGFMDADGTCEPETFGVLSRTLKEKQADIVLGSRMLAEETGMPQVRKFGNRLFATLLSAISASRVTDSASGMRVLSKGCLPLLYPLPDGLHFTPAMSAKAVLDPNLRIVEVPMNYRERLGESKLSALRDGFRFLAVILEIALSYKPLRFFGAVGLIFLLLALGYGLYPLAHYGANRFLYEWMIYRLLAVTVFSVAGLNLIAIGLLATRVVRTLHRLHRAQLERQSFYPVPLPRWQKSTLNCLPVAGIALGLAGIAINWGILMEYIGSGHISTEWHWSYPVTGAFLVLTGLQLFSFGIIHRIFSSVEEHLVFPGRS